MFEAWYIFIHTHTHTHTHIHIYVCVCVCVCVCVKYNLLQITSFPYNPSSNSQHPSAHVPSNDSSIQQLYKIWTKCDSRRTPFQLDRLDQLLKIDVSEPHCISWDQKQTYKLYYTLCNSHWWFLDINLCARVVSHKTSGDWYFHL